MSRQRCDQVSLAPSDVICGEEFLTLKKAHFRIPDIFKIFTKKRLWNFNFIILCAMPAIFRSRPLFSRALLAVSVFSSPLAAFPPAPYFTLYGTIRDQVGQRVTAEGAMLVLLKGGVEVARTPVISGSRLDENFELSMRIDANRPGLPAYTDRAIAAQSAYGLAVEMNGVKFYPIEASGTLTSGKGGERVRLDLNLGEDRDGDGLPDVWEEWQLFQAGESPDGEGRWPIHLLDRNGDWDKDGQNNWQEYLAGTFAGDASESFKLDIKEKMSTAVRFEFYQITGKVYTIERSEDLKTWERVAFHVGAAPEAGEPTYEATSVGVVKAFTAAESGAAKFYRLTVR